MGKTVVEQKKYSVEEVYDMLRVVYERNKGLRLNKAEQKSKKNDIIVDGFRVHAYSQRYLNFMTNGTKCVCCGKEGKYFQLRGEKGTNRRHFDLYAEDGTLITKDHIVPKSRGGRDIISNYQTMCEPCNMAKGNQYDETEVCNLNVYKSQIPKDEMGIP